MLRNVNHLCLRHEDDLVIRETRHIEIRFEK